MNLQNNEPNYAVTAYLAPRTGLKKADAVSQVDWI